VPSAGKRSDRRIFKKSSLQLMSGSFTFANPPNTPSIVGLTPCSHKQSKRKLYNNILIATNPRRKYPKNI